MKLIVEVFVLLAAISGGFSEYSGKNNIVNGRPEHPEDFPYLASLHIFLYNGRSFWCGGSFLSEKWILTAASCIYLLVIKSLNTKK